ncbi:MAG: hypothetical protein NZ750_07885 [Anaerolineae bacterium]|nr:hypothetical protein [Anaerolineae bacterium]MDW8172270.1 hypothetical protein [Anaerolineae bacterium]
MNPVDRMPQDHEVPPTRADIWRSNIVLVAVIVLLLALFIRNASAPREQIRNAEGLWVPLDTTTAPLPAKPYDNSDCFGDAQSRNSESLSQPQDLWLEAEARAPRRLQGDAWTLEWYPVTQGETIIIRPVYRFNSGD